MSGRLSWSPELQLLSALAFALPLACGGDDGDSSTTSATFGVTTDTDSSSSSGDGDGDGTGDGDGDGTGDGDGDGTGGSGSDTPAGIDRPEDPVVMLGAQLPGINGSSPEDVVAFAREGGAWTQIPVQVDERAVQDFCEIYGKSSGLWTNSPACKTDQVVTALFYTDTDTFTGADPQPELDADDELVFMARDAGDRIGDWSEPAGVVAGSGVEVEVADGDERAYVYLFVREDQSLEPGAGEQYVSYSFSLDNGIDYKTQYDLYGYSCGGDNAVCDPSMTEDSTVQGASYSRHFSARWVTDELHITAGDATGVDILDVHQDRFSPASCGRHVLTFSTAEGAYVVNKSGPVRALRSYLGANSGPLTQRLHYFYDQREDMVTHLRVHQLGGGIMDMLDYSEEAIGMTYTNDLNPEGLTIDGVSESANESGAPQWEFVTGAPGSLVMTTLLDISFNDDFAHFYWADEQQASFHQCDTSTILDVPDGSALGTSGTWLDAPLPDTDPKNGSSEHVMMTRVMYFREPNLPQEEVLELVAGAKAPLQATARSIDGAGLGDSCGDGQCDAGEEASCALDCTPIDGSCGDTLCLPPENSTSCAQDCPAEGGGPDGCGDDVCDEGVENELLCAPDCWPPYTNPVACTQNNCGGLFDACADEPECVDLVVCIGPCVAGNTPFNQCINDCAGMLMTSQLNLDTASALLSCGNMANCL